MISGRTSIPLAALTLAAVLTGCGTTERPDATAEPISPRALAFEEPTTTTVAPTTTTTTAPPIPGGSPTEPFAPLPVAAHPTAIVSPTGVVLPLIDPDADQHRWNVLTPCGNRLEIKGKIKAAVAPLGRAHIVLDPGHGGYETGAAGPAGLVEKDLNLAVALETKRLLEERGATVVLTRSTDITMMTSVRATMAQTIKPALFVSIHHNGGAPANGDKPGTIVFTKTNSEESTRFGSLFNQELTPLLTEIGEAKQAEFDDYSGQFTAYEESVARYDQSVAQHEAALVANGQLDPANTTLPPATIPAIDGTEVLSLRAPGPTTTLPIPDARAPVPVPDTLPVPILPPELDGDPIPRFKWAGSANAGVRSWVGTDGVDILSVLRSSGDVPAVLAEFLYVTNPVEEALLADPEFVNLEAQALANSIVRFVSTNEKGTGLVATQIGDENIGGGGGRDTCREPELGFITE